MSTNEWPVLVNVLDRALSEGVPRGSSIVYLDYPVHKNVGDLLIYLGTEEWIKRNELNVFGRWNSRNFTFREIPNEIIIVCQGGGNFGDLYPAHQEFRERVISRYTSNRIVVLPQTLFFQHQSSIDTAARTISTHGQCHILVRDQESAAIARSHFACGVSVAPDMACYLYPLHQHLGLAARHDRQSRRLFLMRKDVEAGAGQLSIGTSTNDWVGDWTDLLGHRLLPLALLERANVQYSRVFGPQNFAAVWERTSRGAVMSAARKFLRAQSVVTSRLHGYIMARLLECDAAVIDNSYGKNLRYVKQWHGASRSIPPPGPLRATSLGAG